MNVNEDVKRETANCGKRETANCGKRETLSHQLLPIAYCVLPLLIAPSLSSCPLPPIAFCVLPIHLFPLIHVAGTSSGIFIRSPILLYLGPSVLRYSCAFAP